MTIYTRPTIDEELRLAFLEARPHLVRILKLVDKIGIQYFFSDFIQDDGNRIGIVRFTTEKS